jgi:hypothetical protein
MLRDKGCQSLPLNTPRSAVRATATNSDTQMHPCTRIQAYMHAHAQACTHKNTGFCANRLSRSSLFHNVYPGVLQCHSPSTQGSRPVLSGCYPACADTRKLAAAQTSYPIFTPPSCHATHHPRRVLPQDCQCAAPQQHKRQLALGGVAVPADSQEG